jgi:hypothetical protein
MTGIMTSTVPVMSKWSTSMGVPSDLLYNFNGFIGGYMGVLMGFDRKKGVFVVKKGFFEGFLMENGCFWV